MKFFKESIDTAKLTQILETSIPNIYSTETINLIDNAIYNNQYICDLMDGSVKGDLIRETVFLERVRSKIEESLSIQQDYSNSTMPA